MSPPLVSKLSEIYPTLPKGRKFMNMNNYCAVSKQV